MWTIKVEDSREYNDERERELPLLLLVSPLYPFLLALSALSALLGAHLQTLGGDINKDLI